MNKSESLGQHLRISNRDGSRVLSDKLVDKYLLQLFVEVVQTWLLRLQDEVGLKREHVAQEASEFIDITADFKVGPRIVRHKFGVVF